MNLKDDSRGNVEMVSMVLYLFILVISLIFVVYAVSPMFDVIHQLAAVMDTSGSLYVDVDSKFNMATKGFFFLVPLMVAVRVLHLMLLAIKRQRYTGESDFR